MVSTCARNSFWILQKIANKEANALHNIYIHIYISCGNGTWWSILYWSMDLWGTYTLGVGLFCGVKKLNQNVARYTTAIRWGRDGPGENCEKPWRNGFFLYLMVMSTMSFNDFYWEVLVAYVNGKLWQYAKWFISWFHDSRSM